MKHIGYLVGGLTLLAILFGIVLCFVLYPMAIVCVGIVVLVCVWAYDIGRQIFGGEV